MALIYRDAPADPDLLKMSPGESVLERSQVRLGDVIVKLNSQEPPALRRDQGGPAEFGQMGDGTFDGKGV
jgi:hypothetical protein